MRTFRHICRRRALAATATLAALSGSTHAQSTLTLYGVADAGVQYLSHADGQKSAWRLQNYGILPSQIGLKGEEDLGGGWRALFKLEQGINLNDGTATVPGYAFFRGAYVGIGGPAGTVTLGRQFSTLFDKTLFYDPLWYAAYSGQGVLVPLSANFIDNSIKYQSATFAGFDVEALAATGGIAGNTRAGRVLELGGQFTSNGLSASAVVHQSHGTLDGGVDRSAQRREIGTFAARYAFASLPLTVYAGVERLTGDLDPARTVVWGGARYQTSGRLGFAGGIYHTDSPTPQIGHPTLFIASTTYSLSKRTVAYLNLGYAKNSGRSSQTVYEYDPTPLAGTSQFGAMLGMYHVF
ncbi:porin [Burkholderia oklahomensis]|uniref:Gram-negative porin family protein n=1 Tax=Burkholderia oklahomensis TaxID=342113 RepID=A0AAI8FPZ8_9BURK|nr:porin [Burkholderia oklahomensis]AIO68352.1 gram-negative porin family protein [Burkholderia oklahomensis]AJX31041.1 gram-negative porin family protein [Burkholderia oklahomensis C6786]AOI42139.1 porin [Burkholderia oklahomensis EO147]AOI45715.1 porin [Burkholderia oklahomensis C6786]KUY51161.1 porin [Burkholderia oklahomensis C6786]